MLTWVGLDGGTSGSNDILQAGVEGFVDETGAASYIPWFEWFCTSLKTTLSETSPLGPSIAAVGATVFIAWKGDGNDNLNFMSSPIDDVANGNARVFANKVTISDTTSKAPVMCGHNGQIYVAWIGSGNDNINIARLDVDWNQNVIRGISAKTTLPEHSPCSPALASVGGRLYLAWKGDSNDNLNVLYSLDDAASWVFSDKLTSPEKSPLAPGLAAHLGKLFITWKGDGNDYINVAQVTGNGSSSTGFSNKVTLGETSTDRASLFSWDNRLFLAWKGDGNDNLNLMYSSDEGATFIAKYTASETSPFGPGLAAAGDYLYICWKGDGNDELNVSLVGVDEDVITGISAPHVPPYVDETAITNMPIAPGDEIYVSVQYLGMFAGLIYFANLTTGDHFSLTLLPPPGATFSGSSIEWIVELPELNDAQGLTSLPEFTPVTINSALGCSAENALANPTDGTTTEIQVDDVQLTNVAIDSATVSVSRR